jgi:hypothetical protein
MTYIIGAAVTAIAFAIFTGMRIDKFYYALVLIQISFMAIV